MVDKVYIFCKTIKNIRSYTAIHTLNNEGLRKENYNSIIYGGLKLWITYFFTFLNLFIMHAQNSFLEEQLEYERVVEAFVEKEAVLEKSFNNQGLSWPPKEIYIRNFKAELDLEIWVLEEEGFRFFKEYEVCVGSGTLGPKLRQGDKQVPEGFYTIDRFNPASNFWLSLGINYPNKVDLIRSKDEDPGGDIFIHGDCVTIGCMPMTDDIIKEIYVLAVLAKNNGQEEIHVDIFPYKFNFLNNAIFSAYAKHKGLWNVLEEQYTYFNSTKSLKRFYMSDDGLYIFSD